MTRLLKLFLNAGFYILLFVSCNKTDANTDPSSTGSVIADPKAIEVLFIGNSLTYTNDLPALLTNHAKSRQILIRTSTIAFPNYALLDHLSENNITMAMSKTKFKYIIVQQGPSSQAEGRAWLIEGATKLKALANKNGASLCIFMVWPAYSNYSNFDGVIKNHTDAASMTNSILCPVGMAWKEYIDRTNDLSYYGPDLFHPSPKGSQVAAEIIFKSLFK